MYNLYLIDEIKCPACGEQHTITREFKTFKQLHSVIKKNMEVPDISYLRFNYNFTDELKEKIICGVKKM